MGEGVSSFQEIWELFLETYTAVAIITGFTSSYLLHGLK